MVQLVDRFGRPLTARKGDLTREIAAPGLTGVRQAWDATSSIAGLTPDRLAVILRQADQGDLDALLVLASEMEERDPHYASVLGTRKLAVVGLERKVTWAKGKEDDPRAEEIQEACEELLTAPEMDGLVTDLLDSVAKPYAVVETIWHTGKDRWTPDRYAYRDPRWFMLDRVTGAELRLREQGSIDGLELQPATFAVQMAANKSGLIARRGLARVVAFSFICKLYGLKDWMSYAEIFGIPLRLGKYEAGAQPGDVEVLKRAVFGLGADAAAVIPASMTIEFPDLGQATGGAELFSALVQFLDNQVSKAVLGQAGTTDMQKGGGYAQANVLDRVRGDLTQADARAVGGTITRDIFAPFVAFNWGVDAPVPRAELVIEEPEDVDSLSTALERLVPLGLKVSQAEIRRKLKLSEPDDDEDVLTPPAQAAAVVDPVADPTAKPPVKTPPPANDPSLKDPKAQAALARTGVGAAIAGGADAEQLLEEAQLAGLEEWEPTFGPEAAAVMALVDGAASMDDVLVGLDRLAGDLAAAPAARALARAMFKASAAGRRER